MALIGYGRKAFEAFVHWKPLQILGYFGHILEIFKTCFNNIAEQKVGVLF
jgi:hypothetical protein